MSAGCVDSFGLSFGWTAFNLIAVYRYGLVATAVLNACMFLGVALSAPATAWLTARLGGRGVLQSTAFVEVGLRTLTFVLLVLGAPISLLALLVAIMNVAAWCGYAGMRAEIAAAAGDVDAMTKYSTVVIGTEAVGALAAALLPISIHGELAQWVIVLVSVVYSASLVPTIAVATRSQVSQRTTSIDRTEISRHRKGPLVLGCAVMVLCSGPTLLFVGLSASLHGRLSVAGAATTFALGALVAPSVGRAMNRMHLPRSVEWPTWGVGMLIGWALAPWSIVGLLVAQFAAGLSLSAFQGVMDFALVGGHQDGEATVGLAQGSAARAAGSAAAVRIVPFFARPIALTQLAIVGSLFAVLGAVLTSSVQIHSHFQRIRREPQED
jgi:hypothetical protein